MPKNMRKYNEIYWRILVVPYGWKAEIQSIPTMVYHRGGGGSFGPNEWKQWFSQKKTFFFFPPNVFLGIFYKPFWKWKSPLRIFLQLFLCAEEGWGMRIRQETFQYFEIAADTMWAASIFKIWNSGLHEVSSLYYTARSEQPVFSIFWNSGWVTWCEWAACITQDLVQAASIFKILK